MKNNVITEIKLGISPDYQYRAITKGIWPQKNWHRNKFRVLEAIMKSSKSKTALDLGTGSGNFEILFSSKFKALIGVDHNGEALAFLDNQLRMRGVTNVKLIRSDIRDLPKSVTSKRYDLIVIIDAIEHVHFDEATKILKNLKKLLSDNGQLIVITPNYKSLWILIEDLFDRFSVVPKFADEQHLAKFDLTNLRAILKDSGYTNIKSFSFNLFSYLMPFRSLCNHILDFEIKHAGTYGCLVCVSASKGKSR